MPVSTADNDMACHPRDFSSGRGTCWAYQIPVRTNHIYGHPIKHTWEISATTGTNCMIATNQIYSRRQQYKYTLCSTQFSNNDCAFAQFIFHRLS